MGTLEKSSAAGQEPPTTVRWRILALLLAFSFMSWFNRASMAAAGDERIMPRYGISTETMGWVYSVFLLVYAVFMTPGGWFIDRHGARTALAVMGFGSALFGALTGSAALLGAGLLVPGLLVIRGLMGLFSAPIYPACGRVVSRWVPYPQRALANGLVTCAAPVGIAFTFVGFGALMDWVDWTWAFAVTGGVTALLALAWTLYSTEHPAEHPSVNAAERHLIEQDEPVWSASRAVPESDRELWGRSASEWDRPPSDRATGRRGIVALLDPILSLFRRKPPQSPPLPGSATSPDQPLTHPAAAVEAPGPWRVLLGNRSLMLLTLSYGAVSYFEYLFTFWMHHYFDDVLHMGKVESRYYTAVVLLAEAVGMALGGLLSVRFQRRYGVRRGRAIVPVAGLLGSAFFLFVGLLATQPGWIVTWFGLAVGCVGMCEGPFWTTAVELGGKRGGTAAGICNTGGNAGGLVAPIITPWVSRHLGWPWGIGLGSLVCLVGAALWWWIDPEERCQDVRPVV
jgi:ACS family glucarate transporter-like MFS transporter